MSLQQLQHGLTFLTSLIISSINKQEARTLREPGQDEELQDCWDTGGGEQDGPVLFFTQELSVKSPQTSKLCYSTTITAISLVNRNPWKLDYILGDSKKMDDDHLLEANHLSKQDPNSDENGGSHSHGTTKYSWSYFPQIQRLNTKANAFENKAQL